MTPEPPPPRSPLANLLGAIAFYTVLPVPPNWPLEFRGIARWAPIVGLLIGGGLGLLETGLYELGVPTLTRSAIVVASWVGITGGLHLDGAMDTADGLGVMEPQKRLTVMADSRTGAFGAIAAGVILLLKTVALSDLSAPRPLVLMAVAGWGRWGQLVAIARYPYLKPNGKGAFHKTAIRSPWEAVPSLIVLLGLSGVALRRSPHLAIAMALGGGTIALTTGAYFNRKLGGHTGDTYGAVVEWTESLLLCWLTVF